MTREQAINSMISHGFTVEQAGEIIKAVTPQLSSELEKNSKKLEKDFGELVEIDLYSVIKQKYIEREVLDKIRAEIEQARKGYEASMDYTDGAREQELSWVLDVIDKYRAESLVARYL